MSAVDRHAYMDSQRTAVINEQIKSERSQQRKYFEELEADGKLIPRCETPEQNGLSVLERLGVPEFVSTIRTDPAQHMAFQMSKSMWTSNPGYIARDGNQVASVMKKDFAYGEAEVEFMRAQHALQKESYKHKPDEFSQYVEASAKQRLLAKGSVAPQ